MCSSLAKTGHKSPRKRREQTPMNRKRPLITSRRHGAGFTLVEIMVACVIVATALLGVYETLNQALRSEQRVRIACDDREAAHAIVTHIADSVERVVNLPKKPTIVLDSEGDSGECSLALLVGASGSGVGGGFPGGLQWRRYSWPASSDKEQLQVLRLQTLDYAGAKNITAGMQAGDQVETLRWDQREAETIGERISELSIACKPLSGVEKVKKDRSGDISVHIRVKVGDETVERVIVPKVNAAILAPQSGEQQE